MKTQNTFKLPKNVERPLPITIICILGLIGAVVSLPGILSGSPQIKELGEWFHYHLAISTIFGFCCFLGLWSMKRWALYLYSGILLINQIILLIVGLWNPSSLILPLLVVIFGVAYFHKMD
ncbi:hypothetical protein [Nafulsella turpanensis]|uniref:hypothetical protein n=1 Tax=Nafulsella turpanensis TaxID=1265690 RepID=UPI000380E537|nr:hypothetical protein [Nafulsella turpanensis]